MRNPLPYIAAFLTQHDREIVQEGVDFEWSNKSWTHNAFRALELVFGRKAGIRCESSATVNEQGIATYRFFTLEAAIGHAEGIVRGLIPQFKVVRIYVPALSFSGGFSRPPSPYFLAIAFDVAGNTGTFAASPQSVNVAPSGSNRFMFFSTMGVTDSSTGCTFDGVSATSPSLATSFPGAGRGGVRIRYLVAPNTGSHSASFSASTNCTGSVASYTGVDQASPLGANGSNTASSSNNITCTITIGTANSWIVAAEIDSGAGSGPSFTPGANANGVRASNTAEPNEIYDGGPFSTGSIGITINMLGSVSPSVSAVIGTEVKAAATAVTVTPDLRSYFYS